MIERYRQLLESLIDDRSGLGRFVAPLAQDEIRRVLQLPPPTPGSVVETNKTPMD